jgi:HPt (histidine-containing phosphotransfer) domain-containing protein
VALTGFGYRSAMAYDPGTLNASLAAAVGADPELMAELRAAFVESAARQLDLMGRARCDANWQVSASRLKSVAASFGVTGLLALADEALEGAPGDPVVLRKLAATIDDFATG